MLEQSIQKQREVNLLRQKLEEAEALHETTIKELNRIHDDKLLSLEQELGAVRQEKLNRSGLNAQVQEKYRQDLVEIKKTHEQEVAQLLRDHQEEVGGIKAQFEGQKAKAVAEYEVRYCIRLAKSDPSTIDIESMIFTGNSFVFCFATCRVKRRSDSRQS